LRSSIPNNHQTSQENPKHIKNTSWFLERILIKP